MSAMILYKETSRNCIIRIIILFVTSCHTDSQQDVRHYE